MDNLPTPKQERQLTRDLFALARYMHDPCVATAGDIEIVEHGGSLMFRNEQGDARVARFIPYDGDGEFLVWVELYGVPDSFDWLDWTGIDDPRGIASCADLSEDEIAAIKLWEDDYAILGYLEDVCSYHGVDNFDPARMTFDGETAVAALEAMIEARLS